MMWESINNFHFIRPYYLLLVVPLTIVLVLYARRHLKAGSWSRVCDERLLPFMLVSQQQVRSPKWILLMGLCGVLAIIAMAGPAWKQLPQPVFRSQASLVIALDLSRSMDVEDIKPSRLARARHKILDILNKRQEGQTALIVYAAEPFVVTPLTEDTNTVATLVKDLTTDLMPSQGSYPEKAILHAVELFKHASAVNGHVLLVTDGIESSGMDEAVQQLTDSGYRLSILGVGTEEGAPIADYRGGFVKDQQGAIVVARLDEQTVAQYAKKGHGIYRSMTANDRDINDLLQVVSASRLQDDFAEQDDDMKFRSDQWREEGPWLVLLLLPVIALAFRRGYLVILVALLLPVPQTSEALDWSSLWKNSDQQAKQALDAGDSKTAAELFANPEWKAAANYRAGDYQQSVESLQGLSTADALYNKGNALARLGDVEQAMQAYEEALKLNPQHEDAKYNRRLLEEFMKQNPQNQQQNNQSNSDQSQQDQSQQNQSQNQQSQQSQSQNNQSQDGQSQQADKSQDQERNSQQQSGEQQDQQQSEQQSTQQDSQEQSQDQLQQQSQNKKQDEENAQAHRQQQNNDEENQSEEGKEGLASRAEVDSKTQQKTEQWLRRIPDDPGGLLRRKFRYQSQLNQRQAKGEPKPW